MWLAIFFSFYRDDYREACDSSSHMPPCNYPYKKRKARSGIDAANITFLHVLVKIINLHGALYFLQRAGSYFLCPDTSLM